jgi:hypothetical protein
MWNHNAIEAQGYRLYVSVLLMCTNQGISNYSQILLVVSVVGESDRRRRGFDDSTRVPEWGKVPANNYAWSTNHDSPSSAEMRLFRTLGMGNAVVP